LLGLLLRSRAVVVVVVVIDAMGELHGTPPSSNPNSTNIHPLLCMVGEMEKCSCS
jgi:hypothetical protein